MQRRPLGGGRCRLPCWQRKSSHVRSRKGKAVDKWQIYRNLCEGKSIVGIGDRALAVLTGLLSFYPDDELSRGKRPDRLSRRTSSCRCARTAWPMPRSGGIWRLCSIAADHLRRDSPNGKRYARKGRGGEIEDAFGFSLAPLLARADEFEAAAERVRADSRALKLMRERITLQRRDIAQADRGGDRGGCPRRLGRPVEAFQGRCGPASAARRASASWSRSRLISTQSVTKSISR